MGKIYKITNDLNDKVYVGQTIQSLSKRFNAHCSNSNDKSSNMYIKRAILKYGRKHFTITLIEECEDSLLDEREIYWISYFDSYKSGYNLTEGGNSNREFLTTALEESINILDFISFIIDNYPTAKEVADKFNICHSSVYNLIKRINNPQLKLNPYNPRKAKTIEDINKEELLKLYNEGWSILDLVKKYKVRKNKISDYLKSQNIKPRRGLKGYTHRI